MAYYMVLSKNTDDMTESRQGNGGRGSALSDLFLLAGSLLMFPQPLKKVPPIGEQTHAGHVKWETF